MNPRTLVAISAAMLLFAGGQAVATDPGTACAALSVTGTCNGVSGYPVRFDPASPNGVSPLCPPYNNPLIVFAPHPDDETLAMSGPIRAARDAGRQVIVELMTSGDQSGFCASYGLTTGTSGTCGPARCREFMAAMQALGVDGVTVNNFGDKMLLSGGPFGSCPSPATPDASKVPQRVQFWKSMAGTANINGSLSLRGTVGTEDGNESGQPICHPDHLAVRAALQNASFPDTKWYSVYIHSDPNRFSTTSGIPANYDHEPITYSQCNPFILAALNAYQTAPTTIGYLGAQGAFDNEVSDCQSSPVRAEALALKTASSGCPEPTCVNPDGEYISHFTGANCDGTESYYLPYDWWAYVCRPYPASGAQCGTIQRTVTNRSYRYAGQCYANAWPDGNTLDYFVTVYRNITSACGEGRCVQPDGQYISHFTGANCDGTESYYLPYDAWAYQCRPDPSSGAQCGTIQRTVTNRSYRYNGSCFANAWPNGNTLDYFVTVYR